MVRRGEGCFATAKPKLQQRGPLGFTKAKRFVKAKEGHNKRQILGSPRRRGLCRGEGCRAETTNLAFLAHLWPIFLLPINIRIIDLLGFGF